MNVTISSLEQLNNHWALQAIGADKIDYGHDLVNRLLVNRAVGQQIQFDIKFTVSDWDLLDKLAMAYELASIEGLNDLLNPASQNQFLREQCAAGAYRAFEIRNLYKLPESTEKRIYHILHLSSLAYCGDRWNDLRRWFKETEDKIQIPSAANASWDNRLLYRLFECWVRLLRKKRWDDLDRIREIIAGLRNDQKTNEAKLLSGDIPNAENRALALRLLALYHWAKSTELLAQYMIQGEPASIFAQLNKHFEAAIDAATACADSQLEVLLKWLHIASRQMVSDSIWWVARRINSRVTQFVENATRNQSLFELLPPQRTAIQKEGLLDQAATAIVVDMPTSGGKTLLAKFRILQALNQFDRDESGKGWVAYVAPTKALTAQITRTLRRDFEPIGINVELLTGAVEIDALEEDLLSQTNRENAFDVLVATPEKLQLIIRNKKISRPLALVVMDEAHNIENESRGLRIELLLATIKGECTSANFLLLMPYVERPEIIARWLAQDVNAGRAISLGSTPWKPNERIVGIFQADEDKSVKAGWRLKYQTLLTSTKTIHLNGEHFVGGVKPLGLAKSTVLKKNNTQTGITFQTAAMAQIFSERGTSIAVANNTNWVWGMARKLCENMEQLTTLSDEICLVQNYLRAEISENFELINMLSYGVGVHHTGLSDETRALMEWLAEKSQLRILCATTTIAQGINFPVSSVFLTANKYPYGQEMSPREFWNLAGRAGRFGHDSVGVVGIAAGKEPNKIVEYVAKATGELASRLVTMLDDLVKAGRLNELETVIQEEQWEDFRCYVAHLWREHERVEAVLSETEQLLRNTFGYGILESRPEDRPKAEKLLEVTRNYARNLALNPGNAKLADMTGFSPEGITQALRGMGKLEKQLTPDDWQPASLFGQQSGMSDLFGVMMKIPQLREGFERIAQRGLEHQQIANLTKAWVNGVGIEQIAREFFSEGTDQTNSITAACQAIYKTLANNGTWGISALSRLGIDFEHLSESEKRQVNLIPAMIYHGVRTEEGVLMRMNAVPRSIAEPLGAEIKKAIKDEPMNIQNTRRYLKQADNSLWNNAKPKSSPLSGSEYKHIWKILSGEGN